MINDFIIFNIGYIDDSLNESIDATVDYIFTNSHYVSWAVFYRKFEIKKV